jgi:thioredoxin-like negative regulator of GroEL
MSYTINQARHEQDEAIQNALDNQDGDMLLKLAERLAEGGDHEQAEELLTIIAQWKKEDDADWDYDRAVDNGLI